MVGKVDVDVNAMNIDLASISSHKVSSLSCGLVSLDNYFRFTDLKAVVLFMFAENLVSDLNQSSRVADRKEDSAVELLLHISVSDWGLLRNCAEKK
jgi:hypothetical protein